MWLTVFPDFPTLALYHNHPFVKQLKANVPIILQVSVTQTEALYKHRSIDVLLQRFNLLIRDALYGKCGIPCTHLHAA